MLVGGPDYSASLLLALFGLEMPLPIMSLTPGTACAEYAMILFTKSKELYARWDTSGSLPTSCQNCSSPNTCKYRLAFLTSAVCAAGIEAGALSGDIQPDRCPVAVDAATQGHHSAVVCRCCAFKGHR